MVEGDFLVGWGFVGGEDAADDVGARGGAADVGKLFIPEGLDEVVEVGGRVEWEVSEKDGAGLVEE